MVRDHGAARSTAPMAAGSGQPPPEYPSSSAAASICITVPAPGDAGMQRGQRGLDTELGDEPAAPGQLRAEPAAYLRPGIVGAGDRGPARRARSRSRQVWRSRAASRRGQGDSGRLPNTRFSSSRTRRAGACCTSSSPSARPVPTGSRNSGPVADPGISPRAGGPPEGTAPRPTGASCRGPGPAAAARPAHGLAR